MMFGFGPAFAKLIRPQEDGYYFTESQVKMAIEKDLRQADKEERKSLRSNEENPDGESNGNSEIQSEWLKVFDRLDEADGKSDGLIDRKSLVKWVSALDLQHTIEFEANLNINPRQLERLVSRADENKDGYVDKGEFLSLVTNRDDALNKKQQSLLHQYFKVVAYAEEYSCWPPPIFISCLTILQVAFYIFHIIHFATHEDHQLPITWDGPEPTCSQLIYTPVRRHEAWRFLTYCLVHSGVQHILFNMIMQLFVGLPLEASHGAVRVATVYIAGVLAGSLGTSTLDPKVFLAGASGGVYSLIAAHLATLILNWQEDIWIMRKRFRAGKSTSAKHGHIVRVIRLITVLLYGFIDTGMVIYNRHIQNDASVKTSYIAHLMGALAGFLVGIIVLKNRKVEHWEKKLKVICIVIFLFLAICAVLWNVIGNNVVSRVYGGNSTYFKHELYGHSAAYDESCHYYI